MEVRASGACSRSCGIAKLGLDMLQVVRTTCITVPCIYLCCVDGEGSCDMPKAKGCSWWRSLNLNPNSFPALPAAAPHPRPKSMDKCIAYTYQSHADDPGIPCGAEGEGPGIGSTATAVSSGKQPRGYFCCTDPWHGCHLSGQTLIVFCKGRSSLSFTCHGSGEVPWP